MILVSIRCACGDIVLCDVSKENCCDGDLIEHPSCKKKKGS